MFKWLALEELASAVLSRLKARLIEVTATFVTLPGATPTRVITEYWVELVRPEM